MSGGAFGYHQAKIGYIVDYLEDFMNSGEFKDYEFSGKTLNEFQKVIAFLKIAQIYAQRIDWLICGDDSEESFHVRLKQDLAQSFAEHHEQG